MKKNMKKLIITSLIAMAIIGIMPIGASAVWKKDSNQNYSWVEKGVKAKGWKYIDNNWYSFRDDGVMQTGWIKDGDNWYYLWSNGSMAYDTWLSNGNFWYYFDATGKMISNSTTVRDRVYDFTKPAFIISTDLDGKTSTSAAVTVENTADTAITDNSSSTSSNSVVK